MPYESPTVWVAEEPIVALQLRIMSSREIGTVPQKSQGDSFRASGSPLRFGQGIEDGFPALLLS